MFFAAENLAKKIQGLLSLPLGEFPKQAKVIADETVKKFKAATNKLAMVEANLAQAQEKSQQDESKIVELENEMKVLSKSLQVNLIICVSRKVQDPPYLFALFKIDLCPHWTELLPFSNIESTFLF